MCCQTVVYDIYMRVKICAIDFCCCSDFSLCCDSYMVERDICDFFRFILTPTLVKVHTIQRERDSSDGENQSDQRQQHS